STALLRMSWKPRCGTAQPFLHRVTSGVHCNLAVNPRSVEAQVQGAAVMGLSMCLPGAAITLKDGEVQQSNFGDFAVPRITDMPEFAVHIVPSAEPPTGMGEPGLPPLAPAFANAIARITGKPLRELPFKLSPEGRWCNGFTHAPAALSVLDGVLGAQSGCR